MSAVRLDRLASLVDQEVRVPAWIYNIRSSGKIVFLQLRDGYGFVQAVVTQDEVSAAVWESALRLTLESSAVVTGTVQKHPKREEYELRVSSVDIIHVAEEYPISKKEHGVDFLLDYRHLWLRSPRQWAIQRVRNTLIVAIYRFMEHHGFVKIDAPILTPTSCEGTTDLFAIDYFNDTAYLSQSGQLYIEAALFAHNRVFDFGPTFRAEKSKTRRHLTEFWMMDAEMAFADHDDNIALQEELITTLVKAVVDKNDQELTILERDRTVLARIKRPFVRMSYAQALLELRKLGSAIQDGSDLGGDDETTLSKQYDTPIVIERYPARIKAFYMKRDRENDALALCDDMLAPEGYGEIIGGSQREDDYATLKERIEEYALPLKEFEWYLDLRKYGSVPHSGFGLGLERMVAWVCGLKHVREAIPFPRTIYRLRP